MAQWIRRPPTERKIPGSIPGVEVLFCANNSAYLSRAVAACLHKAYQIESRYLRGQAYQIESRYLRGQAMSVRTALGCAVSTAVAAGAHNTCMACTKSPHFCAHISLR